ncbi:MAG: SGNH hydrolase domain-containing protein, partial [Maricaulaceae bacterium]
VARNKLVRVESCFVQPQQNFSDFNKELCLKSNEVRPNILIYGDSFSSDFYAALTLAYPKINFLQATSANCLPYAKQPSNKNCESLQEYLLSDFLPNTARPLDAIILMGDWGFQHLDSIPEVIETFEPFAQKIIIGGPPIRFAENVPELAMKAGVKDFSELETLLFSKRHPADKVMPYLTEAVKDDAELWDLHKLMISQGERAFNDKRDILFIDFGHLTVEGIHFLSQQLKIQFPDGPLKNVEIKRDLKSIFNHELLTDTHFQGDTSWIFNEYPQKIHNGILVTVNSHALQPVDIKQNTEYLLTVKASCHETQTQGRLQVNWFDDDQAYITNNTKVFDCNFTGDTYESLVISPQLATRAMVYASGHSNDFIIMHDVSLKEQKVPEEQ